MEAFADFSLPFTDLPGSDLQSHEEVHINVCNQFTSNPCYSPHLPPSKPLLPLLLRNPFPGYPRTTQGPVRLSNPDHSFSALHSLRLLRSLFLAITMTLKNAICCYLRLNGFCDRANLIHFQQETVTGFFLHSRFDA